VSFGHNSQVPDRCNLPLSSESHKGRSWAHSRRVRSLLLKAVGPADNRGVTVANGPY
jgi:hypothetical protein